MAQQLDDRRFELGRLVQQLGRLVQEVETLVAPALRGVRPVGEVGAGSWHDQQPGDARLSVDHDHGDDAEAGREDRRDSPKPTPERRSASRHEPAEIEMTTNTKMTESTASTSSARPPFSRIC